MYPLITTLQQHLPLIVGNNITFHCDNNSLNDFFLTIISLSQGKTKKPPRFKHLKTNLDHCLVVKHPLNHSLTYLSHLFTKKKMYASSPSQRISTLRSFLKKG